MPTAPAHSRARAWTLPSGELTSTPEDDKSGHRAAHRVHLTRDALKGPSPLSLRAHSRRRGSPRPSLPPRNCHQGWRTCKQGKASSAHPSSGPYLFPSHLPSSLTSQTCVHSWVPRSENVLFTVLTKGASPFYLGLSHHEEWCHHVTSWGPSPYRPLRLKHSTEGDQVSPQMEKDFLQRTDRLPSYTVQ